MLKRRNAGCILAPTKTESGQKVKTYGQAAQQNGETKTTRRISETEKDGQPSESERGIGLQGRSREGHGPSRPEVRWEAIQFQDLGTGDHE